MWRSTHIQTYVLQQSIHIYECLHSCLLPGYTYIHALPCLALHCLALHTWKHTHIHNMYRYTCIYIYVYVNVQTCIRICIRIFVCTCICMHAWMDTRMDGWMDTRMDGWMDGWMDERMYACMHVCMCVCMHERMYICMYVCRCLISLDVYLLDFSSSALTLPPWKARYPVVSATPADPWREGAPETTAGTGSFRGSSEGSMKC